MSEKRLGTEGGLKLRESYSQLSEEVGEKTEERIFEFYREHPHKIGDILELIKREIPKHLVEASIEAGSEPTPEDRAELEKINASSDHEYAEVKLQKIQHLLFIGKDKVRTFTYDTIFSDDALRTRIYSALGAYLILLKEIAPNAFQEADKFIESCVVDKTRLTAEWRKKLGISKKKAIPSVITKRAREAVFGVSKVDGMAFDEEKNDFLYNDANPVSVWVGTAKKRSIETIVSIDFNEMKKLGVTFTNEQRLNPFDREIHNAAVTLYVAGNEYITPRMIYQVLSGNKKDVDMTPEARKKILDSIDKLRHSDIEIDATAEVNIGWNKKARYKGALIPSERVEIVSLNGQEVTDCIHLFRNSPLYDYANNKNQISRVDIKMLNAPVNNTSESIELKGYMIRQIAIIRNSHSKLKPVIRYDTLYEYLRISAPSDGALRKKKKEVRDKVKTLLDFWKQENLIKDYTEEKEGKTIAKVRIKF